MHERLPLFIILFCSILILGCKAPIQLSTITITEHFNQNFDFSQIDSTEQIEFIGNMLRTKGGINKFQRHINDPDGEGKIKKDALLVKKVVGTDGIIVFTVSLLPFKKKPKKFEINGVGKYDIINTENEEIYFSSTFHLTGCRNCNDINDLIKKDSFQLEITFSQIAINQFNYEDEPGKKFRHLPKDANGKEIDIVIHINLIKQKEYGENCFSINYGTKNKLHKHPVLFDNTKIGDITISPPNELSSKIIDLKNIQQLVRKYKKVYP